MQGRAVCSFALSMKPWVWGFFYRKKFTNILTAKVCPVRTRTWVLCHFLSFRHWSDTHLHETPRMSLLFPERRSLKKPQKLEVGWCKLWHLELQSCCWILQPCWALVTLLERPGGDWKMARVRFAFYTTDVITWVLWLHGCICLFWPVRCQSLQIYYRVVSVNLLHKTGCRWKEINTSAMQIMVSSHVKLQQNSYWLTRRKQTICYQENRVIFFFLTP